MTHSFYTRIDFLPCTYLPMTKNLWVSHPGDISEEAARDYVQNIAQEIGAADYQLSRTSRYYITHVHVDHFGASSDVVDEDGTLIATFTF